MQLISVFCHLICSLSFLLGFWRWLIPRCASVSVFACIYCASKEKQGPYSFTLLCGDRHEGRSPVAHLLLQELTVWIDPIDGTLELVEGFPHNVTILIGVAWKGVPRLGVIFQPFLHNKAPSISECATWGGPGLGVFGLPVQQNFLTHAWTSSQPCPLVAATTRSRQTPRILDMIQQLGCPLDRMIAEGGAGSKILLMLQGKAHWWVFPEPGAKRWDTCAGEALLSCLGGELVQATNGLPYMYQFPQDEETPTCTQGVLASMPTVRTWTRTVLKWESSE